MKAYFMGGGARLVEQFGEYNPDTTSFQSMIFVLMPKGYEYYCYMLLRHQEQSRAEGR